MNNNDIRLPPNDNDAEEAVIGSLLIDGAVVEEVKDFLRPFDFYFEQNSMIYQASMDMVKRHEAINQVTLSQELTRTNKLESVGGVARLSYLISICPTSMDIKHYADIVSRLSLSRQIISAGDRISAVGYEASPDVEGGFSRIDAMVLSLKKNYGKTDLVTPKERANILFNRYSNLNNLEKTPALATGFYDIDDMLGGGQFPGEFTIWAADSGLGKSTLAQDIAINQSSQGDVLFCSGEMTVEALSDKEIAKMVGCNVIKLRAGRYDNELYDKIIDKVGVISERNIYIYKGVPLTISGIRQAAYTMKTQHNLASIWIDYLQRIELIGGREEGVYRKLGNISNELANLAKELSVPVNCLVQLGRDIDKRENKRPAKGDIYESTRMEQDADWIFMLYRVDKYWTADEWAQDWDDTRKRRDRGWDIGGYSSSYPEGQAEIIQEKTRYGSSKRRIKKIRWSEEFQSYQNLTNREETLL
jgi:replicative DNA helicase